LLTHRIFPLFAHHDGGARVAPRLTVLTGETGAGKSILVDALAKLLADGPRRRGWWATWRRARRLFSGTFELI